MTTRDMISQQFKELIDEGQAILRRCGWDGRQYQHFPDRGDYFRLRAQSLNLVRRVCGEGSEHHLELRRLSESKDSSTNPFYLVHCLGVLEAAQRDFERGLLFDLRALVAAELIGDFTDQAEALVQEGYHVPAASLIGAVLEDALRKLCGVKSIPVPDKTKI